MNPETKRVLSEARLHRATQQAAAPPPPDYPAAQVMFRKQKAALTRALNSKSVDAVVKACREAVQAWGKAPFNGAWPDDWSRWQRALDDTLGWGQSVRLEDLQ